MSNFRNLSNNKSIRQPTVLAIIKSNNQTTGRPIRQCNVQPTVKTNNNITGRPIRQCTVKSNNKATDKSIHQPTVLATVKTSNKATVKSNKKATDKSVRQPTVLATVKSNNKATHQTMDQPTVLATVDDCNEANNTIIDQSLVADQAEVKVLKDTVDANHNADLLVEISLDSAVELSLLTDKEEDELHFTKEVPLTRLDGLIPSILVTGPTNPCLTSAAYYANMPKTISPGFLQVPGARHSFFNTPSLPSRLRLRKAQPTRLDGSIPSILVTGPTNPCLTSAAYYANMPKTISPGFLQVPGARHSFFNTPSLPSRLRPRKAQPFRANLGDAELADAFLVVEEAEQDTVDANHNADLLVEISLDSAVELSLLTDKEEDELHITKEVPLTRLDDLIPSILVTGPTNPCLTSAAYYANMPKTVSPGFLQVPGARPSFYNTPSLSTRWSLRKTHSFRANLGDAELADAELDNDDTDAVLKTSLNNLLNFDVLADCEKVEVSKNAASVEEDTSFDSERNLVSVADVDAALPTYTKPTPAPQCSPLPTSTDSLAPTVTMTGPFTSGWRPTLSAHKATETFINSSSVASKNNSIGSSKAKIGCKSSLSSPFQIKSIGSSKTTTIERVSRVPTARASPQPATERVTRSSTRRAATRT